MVGENGGILTPALSVSYHLSTNLRENRINTGDFYGLFCFHCFGRLGPISSLNRHQRRFCPNRKDCPIRLFPQAASGPRDESLKVISDYFRIAIRELSADTTPFVATFMAVRNWSKQDQTQ